MNALDKAKLLPMDLKPKQVIGDAEGEVYIGRMIGEAHGVKRSLDGQGRETVMLLGRFKATPSWPMKVDDVAVDAIISTKTMLTSKEHAKVVAELGKKGVAAVQFAIDIFGKKNKNAPGGFEFVVKEIFPISGADSDPLAAVTARVPADLRTGPIKQAAE